MFKHANLLLRVTLFVLKIAYFRSSFPEVLLGKVVLKICSRRTLMSKYDFDKVEKQFFAITLRHGCYLVNLLHIFRTSFPKNTSGGLLLILDKIFSNIWHAITFSCLCSEDIDSPKLFVCFGVLIVISTTYGW